MIMCSTASKMWITNGNIADVAVVWAKDDEGTVRGFIVHTDAKGFSANKVKQQDELARVGDK